MKKLMSCLIVCAFVLSFISFAQKKCEAAASIAAYSGNVLGLSALEGTVLGGIMLATGYGAYKTHIGEWGKNGTDNFQARQQAIIDAGGKIINQDRWYEDDRLAFKCRVTPNGQKDRDGVWGIVLVGEKKIKTQSIAWRMKDESNWYKAYRF